MYNHVQVSIPARDAENNAIWYPLLEPYMLESEKSNTPTLAKEISVFCQACTEYACHHRHPQTFPYLHAIEDISRTSTHFL